MDDPKLRPPSGVVEFLNAGILFRLAREAFERTAAAPPDRSLERLDAVVALVLAAASLEAFVNEVGAVARGSRGDDAEPRIRIFGERIEDLEKSLKSVEDKFAAFDELLGQGRAYPKGEQLWESFKQLMRTRNALMHMKGDRRQIQQGRAGPPPDLIQSLRKRRILAEFPEHAVVALPTLLATQAAGEWACNTAADMTQAVIRKMPDSGSPVGAHAILDHYFAPAFVRVSRTR
jgi:hypothetical protein